MWKFHINVLGNLTKLQKSKTFLFFIWFSGIFAYCSVCLISTSMSFLNQLSHIVAWTCPLICLHPNKKETRIYQWDIIHYHCNWNCEIKLYDDQMRSRAFSLIWWYIWYQTHDDISMWLKRNLFKPMHVISVCRFAQIFYGVELIWPRSD